MDDCAIDHVLFWQPYQEALGLLSWTHQVNRMRIKVHLLQHLISSLSGLQRGVGGANYEKSAEESEARLLMAGVETSPWEFSQILREAF